MAKKLVTEVVQEQTEHQMEQIFGITPGTTMVDRYVTSEEEVAIDATPAPQYDEKDDEIDNQFQQVFDAAYTTFEAQRMSTEGMPPQFQSRALEVAAQFLTTALAAASEKAKHKQNKDKLTTKVVPASGNGNTTNNTIIMGRNEMLAQLLSQAVQDSKTIE